MTSTAVLELQASAPLLTTLSGVTIVNTGIEYPLSTGPRTFTTEDLASAVAAQDDPAIPSPRIWLGHPDDQRLHGDRSSGHFSGEPAVGKVTGMRLEQDGHKIVGDLSGIPLWLARIMASAFPSRSIEGRSNFRTPTGNQWDFVINELALLGVVWPGVNTIEDIATLYSAEGPQVEIIEANEEAPFTPMDKLKRAVAGALTVEDLRRQFSNFLEADADKRWWWIRAIYVDPNELIVDDDEGGLYSTSWMADGDEFEFGKFVKKKIQYVNASDGGGIRPITVLNEGRPFVAQFHSKNEAALKEDSITINLGAK